MKLISSPPPRYRLADHVRACTHDGQVILLDLRRDKYLGLAGSQGAALSHAISDWPAGKACTGSSPDPSTLNGWLQQLRARKMLADATPGRRSPASIEEPVASLDVAAWSADQHIGWRRALNLARSASIAAFWMRCFSLAEIEVRVRRTRKPASADDAAQHLEHLRDVMSSYCRLRPFLFTVHDRCLFDSLTLVRFLAREGLSARWVIGVRTRPFGAHSWVQSGRLVLNDVHDHVRTYTPILAV